MFPADGSYQSDVFPFEVLLAVELLLSQREELLLLLLLQFTQFLSSLLLQRRQIRILITDAPAGTRAFRRHRTSADTGRSQGNSPLLQGRPAAQELAVQLLLFGRVFVDQVVRFLVVFFHEIL